MAGCLKGGRRLEGRHMFCWYHVKSAYVAVEEEFGVIIGR